ncbi:MAG: hypothetical protein IJ209_02855 [Bacteroidaceae bacterium]|nr:hypothetical protein [Bacteroidaceae bacterium]
MGRTHDGNRRQGGMHLKYIGYKSIWQGADCKEPAELLIIQFEGKEKAK